MPPQRVWFLKDLNNDLTRVVASRGERAVRSWIKITRVSAKFELKNENLKSKSVSLILFAYNLTIGYSKKNREKYPTKGF